MLQNAVGKPVTGENFFDRETEVAGLWSRLATDDVLMLAPRRVGKTSLMYHLRDTSDANGYRAMYVSVADAPSEIGFIRKLLDEIEKHAEKKRLSAALRKSPVRKFFRRIRGIGFAGFNFELSNDAEGHWQAIGESIAAALHTLGGKWLLLIDEVPIFILALLKKSDGQERAKAFLNWFRDVRQNSETSKSVRWFLAGSIGLDTVTRRMALGDTINDLYIATNFGAFDQATARKFLARLGDSYQLTLSDDVIDAICVRTGWLIPFHLQLWFAELRSRCGGRVPTVGDVDAIHELMLSPGKKTYFDYWYQRLREELGAPHDAIAVALLNAVAADPHGVREETLVAIVAQRVHEPAERDERFRFLSDVLLSDGYIVRDGGRYRFMSSLLAEFWRRHIA